MPLSLLLALWRLWGRSRPPSLLLLYPIDSLQATEAWEEQTGDKLGSPSLL